MFKPWSITTTVRSPERLRDFLITLSELEGRQWNTSNQETYQKLLIKNRLYGFRNQQFYNGLTSDIVNLLNNTDSDIDNKTVEEIVQIKNYRDFAMRGRQSINPLTKFGFAFIDNGIVKITDLGNKLINSDKDFGDVFLKSFIKWQIPNPASDDFSNNGDYDIVPFVATLKLIDKVNELEMGRNNKAVGLSKREFSFFVPSLVNHVDIDKYAKKIIELRDSQKSKSKEDRKQIRDDYRQKFASDFLGTTEEARINKFLSNLRDYGDNTIRYFRLTRFIRIRGNGFYIDLEPNRHIEIKSLFDSKFYKAKNFNNRDEYLNYMSNDSLPVLPWKTRDKLVSITNEICTEIARLQKILKTHQTKTNDLNVLSVAELDIYINELRNERIRLQEKVNHQQAQPIGAISEYIDKFNNIYKMENRALLLEYLTTMGLHALNDAIEIKPNYPVGDDNEPTSTAPGGVADIECYYNDFNMICEVTMLRGRDQWFNEGQPVMRHLRQFEDCNNINSYCLFVAPSIHADSAETFYVANTYGYNGRKQKIAPITISQFVKLLETLKTVRENNKDFCSKYLHNLIEKISKSADSSSNSEAWVANIEKIISIVCDNIKSNK